MRLICIIFFFLATVSPAHAQAAPIRGSLTPMVGKPGHAVITWQVDPGVRQWWLYHCGPRDGACSVAQTGIGTGKGALEAFSPQANERWILKAVDWQSGYYSVDVGSIPGDWTQRWVLLPVVIH